MLRTRWVLRQRSGMRKMTCQQIHHVPFCHQACQLASMCEQDLTQILVWISTNGRKREEEKEDRTSFWNMLTTSSWGTSLRSWITESSRALERSTRSSIANRIRFCEKVHFLCLSKSDSSVCKRSSGQKKLKWVWSMKHGNNSYREQLSTPALWQNPRTRGVYQ